MFKKILVLGIVLGVVVVVGLGVVGYAYAQDNPPGETPVAPWGWQSGMMGRGGGGGHRGMMGRDGAYGPMHEYMFAALAEGLGMTAEELQARVDAGETPYQVAQSQGLSEEEIEALFDAAHDTAIQAAIEAGVLTQEQAELMEEHHEQMWNNGVGNGTGDCMGGGYGAQGGRGRGGRQNQP